MQGQLRAVQECIRMLVREYSSPLALMALGYAAAKYEGAYRDVSGEPYIEHPARVARLLSGFPSPVIIAALLHDVVENTDTSFEELEVLFPHEVVEIVRVLTATRYSSESEAIRSALRHPLASVVMVADRFDNISSLATVEVPRRREYARTTLEFFIPEAERCAGRFPEHAEFFDRYVGLTRQLCQQYVREK